MLRTFGAALDHTPAPGLTPQSSIPTNPREVVFAATPGDRGRPTNRAPARVRRRRALRGPRVGRVAICLGGGVAGAVPGVWNASLEWLADHLESRRPDLGLLEVRYRIRSWRDLPRCIEDAEAALEAAVCAARVA